MRDANTIMRERQQTIRGALDSRDISLKAIAIDSGIPYATIVSYFTLEKDKEPATISGASLFKLCKGRNGQPALPLDLLSLLLPDGLAIVHIPEGLDHDAFEGMARDYLACKGKAHHPDSPAGREISDCEREKLDGLALRLVA